MSVKTITQSISSQGDTDIIDITPYVSQIVNTSDINNGLATVFINGSTAGVTTIEYESGVVSDLANAFERIVPKKMPYKHNLRWGDGNGYSHVRASFLGPSLTVPFRDKELLLGTWQQIVLIDFDNRPRKREFIVQLMGE